MKKIILITAIALFSISILFSLSNAQEERLTITTYYPSPYGSYRDLTVSRAQAIGDLNNDGMVNDLDLIRDPLSGEPTSGTLAVQRQLSIGTVNPRPGQAHIFSSGSIRGGTSLWLEYDYRGPRNGDLPSRWNLQADSMFGRLLIAGSDGNRLVIDNRGFVGINTGDNILGSMLTIGPMDGISEGGEIRFLGAGVNRYFYLDNFDGRMRFVSEDLSGATEKLTILNDGSVGIGTDRPWATLDVRGRVYINPKVDNNAMIDLAIGDTGTGLHRQGDGRLGIFTNNIERIRINESGNVGIGRDDPRADLDVRGNLAVTDTAFIGYEIVFQDGIIAPCPAGKKVLGCGCRSNPPQQLISVSVENDKCKCGYLTGSGVNVITQAICARVDNEP